MNGDMFLFDEFQSNRPRGSRRPVVTTLFDVFSNIAADEAEHVSTMQSCQDPEAIVQSPNNEKMFSWPRGDGSQNTNVQTQRIPRKPQRNAITLNNPEKQRTISKR